MDPYRLRSKKIWPLYLDWPLTCYNKAYPYRVWHFEREFKMADIVKSLESIEDLKKIVIMVGEALKGGLTLEDLPALFSVLVQAKELFDDAGLAVDELKDLDPTEIGTITSASYLAVKEIIEALKA